MSGVHHCYENGEWRLVGEMVWGLNSLDNSKNPSSLVGNLTSISHEIEFSG